MILANITISVDSYVTGPDDGPGCGLGVGKDVGIAGGADMIR
jgi:hypothetical protein